MKTKTTLAALLLAAVMVTPSYGADEFFLEGAEDHYRGKRSYEYYYFIGRVDGLTEFGTNFMVTSSLLSFKIPEGVSYGQARTVVARYVHDHPEKHHWPHRSLVTAAVEKAWPKENNSTSLPKAAPVKKPPNGWKKLKR